MSYRDPIAEWIDRKVLESYADYLDLFNWPSLRERIENGDCEE